MNGGISLELSLRRALIVVYIAAAFTASTALINKRPPSLRVDKSLLKDEKVLTKIHLLKLIVSPTAEFPRIIGALRVLCTIFAVLKLIYYRR